MIEAGDFVISEEQLEGIMDNVEADRHYKAVRSQTITEALKAERKRVLDKLCDLCPLEECRPQYCGIDSMREQP